MSNGWWGSIFDPATWTSGIGGAAFGLATGHFRTNRGRITKLEREVEECRKRDADVQVLAAGFRMVVGEMMRDNPHSVALAMCGDLLNRKLGPPPTVDDLADLLKQVDEGAEHRWRNRPPGGEDENE